MHKHWKLNLSIWLYFLICPMDGLYSDKVKILDTFVLQSINHFSFKGRNKAVLAWNLNKTCKKIIESIFNFIYHVKQLLLNSKHFLAVQDFPSQCVPQEKREQCTLNLEKLDSQCHQHRKLEHWGAERDPSPGVHFHKCLFDSKPSLPPTFIILFTDQPYKQHVSLTENEITHYRQHNTLQTPEQEDLPSLLTFNYCSSSRLGLTLSMCQQEHVSAEPIQTTFPCKSTDTFLVGLLFCQFREWNQLKFHLRERQGYMAIR